ncbi:precorrin-2 C(20)-methyltransferase [Methylobrevis pamukkalensis]|uniref:Precorrin-2 C(20)-methyltransferase n=1 Tax=Methylobrevis pamukkalensis TaxID=1439726 RepID=A0A1E3H0N0_9HYPH|nr:precorrin-2 C(20)-methyltransferase [Methylobrevis pamukkalensis]ODN69844.1 Precorrin-2 C(20)-methyltransferase [Methylobrevis pamukkalensis]
MLDPLSPLLEKERRTGVAVGTLHGVGLGPGDPELMTIRAVRMIRSSPVIAYFAKAGRRGNARAIVDPWVKEGTEELPLLYPVTTEIHFAETAYVSALAGFYEESALRIAEKLDAGQDVALICEGDPMFYGSFMHLFERLKGRYQVSITAGVSGMSGCFAAAGRPMTWGDDVLTVLPGTLDGESLARRLAATDAAVIMKLGKNLPKVRAALTAAGLIDRAIYVERGTMAGECVIPLALKADDEAPYFSMVLVPGEGRRP